MWDSGYRLGKSSDLLNIINLVWLSQNACGLILSLTKKIILFCLHFFIQHLMEKSPPGLRQAHLPHDFLMETTQDTEEKSYYASPRRILLEVTPSIH